LTKSTALTFFLQISSAKMNYAAPITGLTLEGFQVFEKSTYIPLNRLTLLFGPNSAGKSAVLDAIEFYNQLMVPDSASWYGYSKNIKESLIRHWRKNSDDINDLAQTLRIQVDHNTQCDVSLYLDQHPESEFLARNEHSWTITSKWNFDKRRSDEETDFTYNLSFEFFMESELIFCYCDDNLFLNLSHPLLRQIEIATNFQEVAQAHPDAVTLKDGKLTIYGVFFGFNPTGPEAEGDDKWLRYHPSNFKKNASIFKSQLFLNAFSEINLLIGTILKIVTSNSRFRPTKVGASRTIPSAEELRFQLGYIDDAMHPEPSGGNKKYKALANSLASELVNFEKGYGTSIPEQATSKHPETIRQKQYANAINHALTDHLFLDQGYRLDYDFRLLMSKNNSKAGLIEGMSLDPAEFGFLIEINLRDSRGRKYIFEDVGSGIGYLLPVLCAVYDRSNSSTTCFIQQPELHLHPALQAAMGDVFIESSEENRQVLLETHSEHLLLRILKRIRQTHLQVNIAPELKISADDVCVLYFDPSPDGTTSVKRLRITEDGEFMDRWPRGFFGERDQELLDE